MFGQREGLEDAQEVTEGLRGISAPEASLGDRLFEGALKYANQSLHGRFITQMVDGSLPQAAFDYYLHPGRQQEPVSLYPLNPQCPESPIGSQGLECRGFRVI